MTFFKTATALLISIVMFISNNITALMPRRAPEPLSEKELLEMDDYFDKLPLAEEIIVVKNSALSNDEHHVIVDLQGLVNRTEGRLYIQHSREAAIYELEDFEAAGCRLVYTNADGEAWNFTNLIKEFSSYITDNGYVLFSATNIHDQLNMAFNYSTVFGWLAVPKSLEEKVIACGLEKKEDLSERSLDFTEQREFYKEYKHLFRNNSLVHLYSYTAGLRDFAVQQKIFITYTDEEKFIQQTFRDWIYRELEPASIILGWCDKEGKYTEVTSLHGHYVIPSDHNHNVSMLNSKDLEPGKMGKTVTAPKLDPNKHYIALVCSDGDNTQWIANGFEHFYGWQKLDIDVPITWTFAPQQNTFAPIAVKRAVANVNEDSFITGPSGAGYARINGMNGKKLEAYSNITASTMLKSGLTIMTLLNNPTNALTRSTYIRKLEYFARYDNINGGILQMDTDQYSAGGGEVYFANDKAFVSVRVSLWHPSGDPTQLTKEWLDEKVALVNNLPADNKSINGYSVVNIHPWTMDVDDIAYFVSQLDDGVEVISAEELVLALAENIPHKYAKPE